MLVSLSEPKAHKVSLLDGSRDGVHLCVRVNTFKHEYLRDQQANGNQILSEASFGKGKGCIRFWARSDRISGFHGNTLGFGPDRIGTLVSMATDSSHRLKMGKTLLAL